MLWPTLWNSCAWLKLRSDLRLYCFFDATQVTVQKNPPRALLPKLDGCQCKDKKKKRGNNADDQVEAKDTPDPDGKNQTAATPAELPAKKQKTVPDTCAAPEGALPIPEGTGETCLFSQQTLVCENGGLP